MTLGIMQAQRESVRRARKQLLDQRQQTVKEEEQGGAHHESCHAAHVTQELRPRVAVLLRHHVVGGLREPGIGELIMKGVSWGTAV